MPPADRRYWDEVAGENLRLYKMIQQNSGQRPHHSHRSLVGKKISTAQSHIDLPSINPTPRSHRPSEKRYWDDVARENRRLLGKILDIQVGKRKRSESSPPIYPAPRRYYPNEVLYWKGVSQENARLLNKIFDIEKGKLVEKKPIILKSRKSSSLRRTKSCSVNNNSTYCQEYGGGNCPNLIKQKSFPVNTNKVEVEVCFEDPDTGNIVRENIEVDLHRNRNRGTMTETSKSLDDISQEEHSPFCPDSWKRPPWK